MSRGAAAGRVRARPGAVLIFGENLNDSRSIAHLLVAANSALTGRVRAVPRPTSLTRDAGVAAMRTWLTNLSDVVTQSAAAGRPVDAVVVHQDADGPDAGGSTERALGAMLNAAVPAAAHACVPVQMTEAWWLLFPDAVETVAPRAWKQKIPRKDRAVELVHDPKAELRRLTRPTGREYVEADSPTIAESVLMLKPKRYGTSPSYERLQELARRL